MGLLNRPTPGSVYFKFVDIVVILLIFLATFVASLCVSVLMQTEFKRIQSPLKYQTRCVATFPGKEGFLVSRFLVTEKSQQFVVKIVVSKWM